MQEASLGAAAPSKTYLTLTGTSSNDDVKSLLQAWSKEQGVKVLSHKVIRVVDSDFSVEVQFAQATQDDTESPATALGFDLARDANLTDFGMATLLDRYLHPGEQSPQEAFYRAARAFADDEAHAQRLYDYASRLWFMFATPVLSNAPLRLTWSSKFEENFLPHHFGKLKRGLPISCFLSSVDDNRKGLNAHYAENALLSSMGGGIGSYWGHIRTNGIATSSGSESSGAIPFMAIMDRYVLGFAQGSTRRASYAMYLDISHPEIIEFLDIRKPTGGDANRRTLNLHNAVNIPDSFMEIIERCMKEPDADDSWPLIDPHTHKVVEVVSAKALWQRLLELRMQTGEPYIHFIDATNRALPKAQRDAGLRVYCSNLCTEITLPTNSERTAVCCLSSVNMEYYDEWSKDEQFIPDLIRMLDNVLQYFIEHAGIIKDEDKARLRADIRGSNELGHLDEAHVESVANFIEQNFLVGMRKAIFSAKQERSVGLGAMGFHSYLQQHNLPYESALATSVNRRIFSHLRRHAERATVQLALERGACPDAAGEMRRNMHLLAVAPNASSSIICGGTSPSTEPFAANAFTQKTQSGSWLVRNKSLVSLLEHYGANTDEVWQSIILNKGSVQQLGFLSANDKEVYKTAIELDQRWVIEHASHRQEYICQGQSTNLFFAANVHVSYLHNVHFLAWKKGLKTLYYLRSEAAKQADTVSLKVSKAELRATDDVCLSCEG